MRLGAVFPQTEIGTDAGAIRAYAVAVEEMGFDHVLAYDHVVGADPEQHLGWDWFYDVDDSFLEPFVLFAHLAAVTSLEMVTGILILPQRQTMLVAKQAATLDVLCEGRLRLGVGLGWNRLEYEALGEDFTTRGARLEAQIGVLRALWTERSVSVDGTDSQHPVTGVGLAPLPVQRPIPLWIGGASDAALARAIEVVRRAAVAAGRDPESIGMEGRVGAHRDGDRLASRAQTWRDLGATHLSLNTMRQGLDTVGEHIEALRRAMEVMADLR
jgi:probable F420-dependent oxidoreductase